MNLTENEQKRARVASVGAIILIVLFVWFGVRSQIGNMLGELTSPSREDAADVAELAANLAPFDPRPRWLAAAAKRSEFSEDAIAASVANLEYAVRLAPHDFRMWAELGRAYEQAERYDAAERALRHAVELAPAYAHPRWQLGNFLLREDRVDEARSELKLATATSSRYRVQVFVLAWNVFGSDPTAVESFAADTADAYANLAWFYAERFYAKDAVRVWNTIPDDERKPYREIGIRIAKRLYDIGAAHEALVLAQQLGMAPEAASGAVSNGGFERPIGDARDVMFGWRIGRGEKGFDAMPDTQVRYEGARSLRVTFRNYSKAEFYNVSQVVAVEPGAKFKLTFKVRTEDLRSGGPPFVEVGVVNQPIRLAASEPFPVGSVDWHEIALEFTVPETFSGIELRTVRASCGDDCPIVGTIWYDDFKLERL